MNEQTFRELGNPNLNSRSKEGFRKIVFLQLGEAAGTFHAYVHVKIRKIVVGNV
jgi:hypothetical protein